MPAVSPCPPPSQETRMPSPFETAPGAAAIPILFATKTNWDAIAKELSEPARQFASANDFTAKPGKCLTLPGGAEPLAVAERGLGILGIGAIALAVNLDRAARVFGNGLRLGRR